MMKKIFLMLVLNISLFGYTSVVEVEFESGVSFYGKVGVTEIVLEQNFDTNRYKMEVTAKSTGILKSLSNNRIDTFTSEGLIKEGVYTPLKYVKKAFETGLEKITTYNFHYDSNNITKNVVKKKSVITSRFDHESFGFMEEEKIIVTKKSNTIKMYDNDFLTLYLNFKHKNLKKGNIQYLDQKDEDSVSLIDENSFNVNKDNGENKIKITLINDEKSIFFKEAISELSFYGDAYIRKISEKKNIID